MTAIKNSLLLAVLLTQAVADMALVPVLDFAGPEAAGKWQAVNDGVMGGVSDGRFKITEDKTLEFFGSLSLENNGGFASVRTKPTDLDIKAGETLVVRVKGDGREYVLNIYTKSRRMAFSYRAPLPTSKDEWTFAKTMPGIPHWYTLQRKAQRDEDFAALCRRSGFGAFRKRS